MSIDHWGAIEWESMEGAFYGALNMVYNATDVPDLSGVDSIRSMFRFAKKFNGDLSSWNVSRVTDMSRTFSDATAFNGNVSSWNVSRVTDMSWMFYESDTFDRDISSWNVSRVTDMRYMLSRAFGFNQDISSWNVSGVTDMRRMFANSIEFNKDISTWDVSGVTDMSYMFYGAYSFNKDISTWDVSSVTDMSHMFQFAYKFNRDITSWNVSGVTDMREMFKYAEKFNGNVSSWNVSGVTDMREMFKYAEKFNGNVSSWDVSGVTDMREMFQYAYKFDGDISSWDVSGVTDMSDMFTSATSFNQNLGRWYVVPEDISIAHNDTSRIVTEITAQNRFLTLQLTQSPPQYNIMQTGDGADFEINGGSLMLKSTPDYNTKSSYTIAISPKGGFNQPNSATFTVTVNEIDAPIAVGADQTVNENTQVTLNGTGSSDPNDDTLTFSWIQTSGPAVSLSDDSAASPTFTTPTVASQTDLDFRLTVSDDTYSDSDTVTVTVLDNESNAPAANAGADQTVNENTQVTLNGTGSSDPNDDTLTFSWIQTSGPAVSLSDDSAASPTFTTPTAASQTDLDFRLTVDDRRGGSDSDTVTVTVLDNESNAPAANAGADQTVNENTQVTLNGTGSSDPNDDTLTFSWIQTSGQTVTLIGDNTANSTFLAPLVTVETDLIFELTVGDGNGGLSTDRVTITVLDTVNENPIASAGPDRYVEENARVTLQGSGSDPNGDSLAFSWSQTNEPTVQLNGANTASPTFTAPQVTGTTDLVFTLTVSDGRGGTAISTVTITVLDTSTALLPEDTNRNPIANAGPDRNVEENVRVTLQGSGSDPDDDTLTFSWSQTAGLGVDLAGARTSTASFTAPQAAETTTLVFTLTVSDSRGGTNADSVRITVRETITVPEPGNSQGENSRDTNANGGGGGGGGGAPVEIITDVRIYSISWDCAARAVSATVGPDSGQLTVLMRTSSVGERPVAQAESSLPGSRTYTTTMSGADQFVVVKANLAYEGEQTITKIVNFRGCAGQAIVDRYEPPAQEPAGTAPGQLGMEMGQQQEICRDGREPAVLDGSRLLCLFPGTFEVLAERDWNLARP